MRGGEKPFSYPEWHQFAAADGLLNPGTGRWQYCPVQPPPVPASARGHRVVKLPAVAQREMACDTRITDGTVAFTLARGG